MGKHYDRTINELNGLMNYLLTEGTPVLPSNERTQLALATISSVLCDIDINLAVIADALEEKKDDKASS